MNRLERDRLATAMGYPFARSEGSFIFVDGKAQYIGRCDKKKLNTILSSIHASSVENRIPVLAYGANASPERLKLKFSRLSQAVFPVVKAKLIDFDVVFASHYSSYGAIPATLIHSPNTTVEVFVTFLEEGQLELMHQSELSGMRYVFGLLNDIQIILDGNEKLDSIGSYWTDCGHYSEMGQAIALSHVPAAERQLKAWTQKLMQSKARDHLDPDKSLTQFVLEHLKNEALRVRNSDKLSSFALPFNYEAAKVIRR